MGDRGRFSVPPQTVKFDGNGNKTQIRDANNILIESAEYDFNNNPTKITDALGNYVTYSYNGLGNLTSYTTASST